MNVASTVLQVLENAEKAVLQKVRRTKVDDSLNSHCYRQESEEEEEVRRRKMNDAI